MNDQTAPVTRKPFGTLLLTGAAGGLGRQLRESLKPWADTLRLSDVADLGEAQEGEQIVQCDLADRAAVDALLEGVDVVLHFGGISVEAPFDDIVKANIIGTANLYEAAHWHGIRRVVFASSNHAVGFYRTTQCIDAEAPVRPDGMYGLSKCFGESLSRYYFDRFGLETVCVRIGSCVPEPRNPRMMATYCSYDDLLELLRCALFTPRVDHTVVFGVSANDRLWWDNSKSAHLGYRPRDSSAPFAGLFPDSGNYPRADDLAALCHGGSFVYDGPQYGSRSKPE
jgi:uronate dehydrogenase